MNLSNSKRAWKLVCNLALNPAYVPRYIRHLPIRKLQPLELEIPWWSYGAIDFIARWCSRETKVFEFGTGGSTLFFSQRCRSVKCVEDDSSWFQKVSTRVKETGSKNVDIRLCPFDFRNPSDFERSDYLRALDQEFDLIVVDGQDWTFNERPICFSRAEEFVCKGGAIVVDDSWRYTSLHVTNRAKSFKVFESVGPSRYGVTRTDVYFY
jgi:hypothetical protein